MPKKGFTAIIQHSKNAFEVLVLKKEKDEEELPGFRKITARHYVDNYGQASWLTDKLEGKF